MDRSPGAKYIAPEVQRGQDYTERCDVFSFALILLECVCGRDLEKIFTEMEGNRDVEATSRESAIRSNAKGKQRESRVGLRDR